MDWQRLPPLSSLRAFAAVADEGGFSQAGRALNVSHAAVGQQVHALERLLGTELVFRAGRGLALTPAGVELAQTLNTAFGDISRAVSRLTGVDAVRPLSISCTHAFASGWLMPRLPDFRKRHPDIELMVNPTPAVVDLAPGGVDIAIRFGKGPWPGLTSELLVPCDITAVAAPSLVGPRRFGEATALLDLPWIQEDDSNEVTTWLNHQGVVTDSRISITHLPGYLAMVAVRRGEGVLALPSIISEDDVSAGRLVVLFQDSEPGRGYHVVTRPGEKRPALKTFLSWLLRQRRSGADISARPAPRDVTRV